MSITLTNVALKFVIWIIFFFNSGYNVLVHFDFHLILIEQLYNSRTVALYRWVYDLQHGIDVSTQLKIPWPFVRLLGNMVKKQSYGQGVGRHSEAEVHQVMEEDLQALSKFLGNTNRMFRISVEIILYTEMGFLLINK